jgi:hypothetical protein
MRRALALAIVIASLFAGCETLTPLQTASTVDPGMWRLGAQLSASPYCTLTLDPTGNCYEIPGYLPLPQLRLAARRGLWPRTDAGLSLDGTAILPIGPSSIQSGFRAGALLDAKVEVWSRPTSSGRHLVAAAAAIGTSLERWSLPQGGAPLTPGVDLLVPIFYGYQTPGIELVASPRFMERLTYLDITGDGRREVLKQPWLGLALGVFTRRPSRWAFGLEYAAPTAGLHRGSWTLSVGVMFDVGAPEAALNPPPR